ncbi:MAG: TIGR01777 family oxidoreductase [Candidatus Kapaibacteriota bacterium]
MKVVIAGITGGIGKRLATYLHDRGNDIYSLTRNKENAQLSLPFCKEHFSWNENWERILPEVDAIVNLSGASIGRRWNKKYKQQIYSSRIETTQAIVDKLNKFKDKSIGFFSTSAIGYFPNANDEIIDETAGPGSRFISRVCVDWEKSAQNLQSPHKLVIGRFGIVLKKDDIALQRILLSYKFGFGVVIGSGLQWISWIHITDLLELIFASLSDASFKGIYNFVAPNPVRFSDLISAIGKILNKPFMLSIPDYLVKLLFGEQSEVLLSSQRVVPKRLLEEKQYKFKYETIEIALREIIC